MKWSSIIIWLIQSTAYKVYKERILMKMAIRSSELHLIAQVRLTLLKIDRLILRVCYKWKSSSSSLFLHLLSFSSSTTSSSCFSSSFFSLLFFLLLFVLFLLFLFPLFLLLLFLCFLFSTLPLTHCKRSIRQLFVQISTVNDGQVDKRPITLRLQQSGDCDWLTMATPSGLLCVHWSLVLFYNPPLNWSRRVKSPTNVAN